MSSIGHPLLGDVIYGPKKSAVPGLQGQTLHAMVLGFIHPISGKYMVDLPHHFQSIFENC